MQLTSAGFLIAMVITLFFWCWHDVWNVLDAMIVIHIVNYKFQKKLIFIELGNCIGNIHCFTWLMLYYFFIYIYRIKTIFFHWVSELFMIREIFLSTWHSSTPEFKSSTSISNRFCQKETWFIPFTPLYSVIAYAYSLNCILKEVGHEYFYAEELTWFP